MIYFLILIVDIDHSDSENSVIHTTG